MQYTNVITIAVIKNTPPTTTPTISPTLVLLVEVVVESEGKTYIVAVAPINPPMLPFIIVPNAPDAIAVVKADEAAAIVGSEPATAAALGVGVTVAVTITDPVVTPTILTREVSVMLRRVQRLSMNLVDAPVEKN